MQAPFDAQFDQQGWPTLDDLRRADPPQRPSAAWFLLLIPVVPFIAFHVLYGLHESAGAPPDFRAGYVGGRVFGGLLLPLIAAAVFYFTTDRSSLAGAVALVVGMVCNVSLHIFVDPEPLRAWKPSWPKHSTSASPVVRSGPVVESFGAFDFELPPAWKRAKPDRTETKAMLLLGATNWQQADAMIKVDVGKPALPTARQTARAMAGRDGHVFDAPLMLDGVEGIRVQTPSDDLSRPRYAVVVYREGKVYLIMAATKGPEIKHAMKQVLDTWQWE
ncbi:MAG: hypothetical protein DWQ37_22500 [Planctomycetota bacterium]|nr:MAG: hypothetical protein DWQ37_22500 [Planctomycetota bacterium]